MDSIQKYLLIGPLLLLVALGVAYLVKRQAAKPRNPAAQLYYARTIERRLSIGRVKASRDNWLECIAQYKRLLEKWPESDEVVEAYVHIGTIYKKRLKDPERAKEWYGRVIEEFPDSEAAEGLRREFVSLAMSHADTEAGRREALAAYTDYIERNPDSSELDELIFKRGRLYTELKRADEAIADFERIIDEFPKSSRVDDAVFYIGVVHHVLIKDGDKALEQYEKLIKEYPKSNQIRVARKRKEQIWEVRVGRMLDEYFKDRYGIAKATMYFTPPTPLYIIENKEDADWADALDKQTLDLKSAELTVDIAGKELVVTGSLVIANPSEIEGEGKAGEDDKAEEEKASEKKDEKEEKKEPAEAKKVWLTLNEGMALRSLTQGEAKVEFKRHRNLVEVTLAEPIAVDGETTLRFEVSNEGKETPGIVIGEEYGHAFAHSFWFPITKLDDEFRSAITSELPPDRHVESNGEASFGGVAPTVTWECNKPTRGRFFMYGPYKKNEALWGQRKIIALAGRYPEQESFVASFLGEAVKAADYLLGVFGSYPYVKIVFAQSPHVTETVFEHGAGLILINSGVPLDSIKPAHICNELVQQWYGCLVYPALDKWLWYTAGVASYYETLYLRHRYDAAAMEAHLAELRELYGEIFAHIGQRTMAYRPEEQSETVFNGLIYTKGAYFMHTLRWIAGDERFIKAQRAFLDKDAFRPVTFKDLRESFDEATGQELCDVFAGWLINAGTPALKVEEWTSTWSGDEIEVAFTLTQQKPKYVLPVELAFEAGEQRVVETARIMKTTIEENGPEDDQKKNGKKEEVWHETFAFTLPFNPERIVLDPNYRILLNSKSRRVWTRPESADEPAEELILELDEAPAEEPAAISD